MNLETLVENAHRAGASDLHLEPQMPPTLRIDGRLVPRGTAMSAETLVDELRSLLSKQEWHDFRERRSADFSKLIRGTRCRINAMQTLRGVGLAIRLLSSTEPSLQDLNLHPSLAKLASARHGLILVSGPTGSGKSSTLAGLLREIDAGPSRHIVTLEHPIEYVHRLSRSLVRQREVGRDTPSFQQGLIDAMREDPDVILVGEIREPETMRLTLDAAETGHLVLTSVHSSSIAEALSRIVSAFPSEIQPLVCTQLADCLLAVVCQTLRYRPDIDLRVPECEILMASTPARSLIRKGDFFKLESTLQTGAADGQWTRERYRLWLDGKHDYRRPERRAEPGASDRITPATRGARGPQIEDVDDADVLPLPPRDRRASRPEDRPSDADTTRDNDAPAGDDVIVIQPPSGTLADILEELDETP